MEKQVEKYQALPARECLNCGHHYEGHFCPNCGQKYIEKRFTFKQSIRWVIDKIFNIEKGFFFTVKELIIRPGITVRNFVNRITVNYMHPFRFVFFLATISAILTVLSGAFDAEEIAKMYQLEQKNAEAQAFTLKMFEYMKKFLAFIMMITIPFNSVASYFIYKSKKYNFAEHLIINSYASALNLLAGIPLLALILIPDLGMLIYTWTSLPVGFLAMWYVFNRFFQENVVKSFFKLLAIYIVGILLGIILGILLGVVGVIIYKVLL